MIDNPEIENYVPALLGVQKQQFVGAGGFLRNPHIHQSNYVALVRVHGYVALVRVHGRVFGPAPEASAT